MNNKQSAIPTQLNLLLGTLLITENILALFALPWLIHSSLGLSLLLLLDIIAIRVTNFHWHLTHEAVHGLLAEPRWLNEWLGIVLGALFFSSFSIARYGHLNHHRNNRYADTQEVYYQEDNPSYFKYYFELLGGFFIVYEFLLIALAWAPKALAKTIIEKNIKRKANRHDLGIYVDLKNIIDNPRSIENVRKESILFIFVLLLSLYSYSQHFIIWLSYFWARAFFVSYLNNMPHYKNSIQTDINASDNAYLPKFLQLCYLNFNYHRVHHRYPKTPWTELPILFKETNDHFDCDYMKVYFQQLKGPVYYEQLAESSRKLG